MKYSLIFYDYFCEECGQPFIGKMPDWEVFACCSECNVAKLTYEYNHVERYDGFDEPEYWDLYWSSMNA